MFEHGPTKEKNKCDDINHAWRDESFTLTLFATGENCTLRECYVREVVRAKEVFTQVSRVVSQEIPEGSYILFVDMAHPGFMQHPEIQMVDKDRLSLVYEAETGNADITQDFQSANMRFCFGFDPYDTRFVTVKPFIEELPDDLHACVGIILSGSETNIKDETNNDRLEMTQKVALFVARAQALGIPLFGICFGAQLLTSMLHAHIQWVHDTKEVEGESGLVMLQKTEKGKRVGSLIEHLPDTFYVHANHRQQIDPTHLPFDLEVLASSKTSQVQIVQSKKDNMIIAVQNHIECGDTRGDLASDIGRNHIRDMQLFQGESIKARAVLCPKFLQIAGEFARARNVMV